MRMSECGRHAEWAVIERQSHAIAASVIHGESRPLEHGQPFATLEAPAGYATVIGQRAPAVVVVDLWRIGVRAEGREEATSEIEPRPDRKAPAFDALQKRSRHRSQLDDHREITERPLDTATIGENLAYALALDQRLARTKPRLCAR